jgi:4-amino-4-deoxy-L-arabinose transferase-like glycosyltransferase
VKVRAPHRGAWLVLLAAVLGTLTARAITWYALGDVPHVMDEIAYLLQARTLGGLHVSAPVHLPRAAFSMWFVDDRWATYSIFPPGWPAVLAIGERLGLRAWVNPVLHGITVWIVARTARRVAGARAAIVTSFAYALSPQALILAGSFMSHTLVALCAATAVRAGVALVTGRPRAWMFALAGVGLGMAALSRPLCAVVIGVGFAAFVVSAFFRHPLRRGAIVRACALVAAPFLGGVLLLGAYNHALTGKASRFPQSSWFDEHAPPVDIVFFQYRPGCNELGFGPGHGCDFGIDLATHDLKNALSNTGDNLTSWALLAGGGPLAFVGALYALSGGRRAGRRRRLRVGWSVAAVVPAAIVLYGLYWYAGTCYGGRFYHAALPALILLSVHGMTLLARRRVVAMLGLGSWIVVSAFALVMSLGEVCDDYWGTDNRFDTLASSWRREPALVMVAFHDDGTPMRRLTWTGFAARKGKPPRWLNSVRALAALGVNDPELAQPMIFSKYDPALVAELKARFPSRAFYIYIASADRKQDRLVKYDGSPFEGIDQVGALPKDNFDAYTVPPYAAEQR